MTAMGASTRIVSFPRAAGEGARQGGRGRSCAALPAKSFRAPAARESLSLCVAKEKVTKEKGHPAWRFPGIHARKVREPGAGFSKVRPCTCEKASASCRRPLRGLSSPSHRRTGAPAEQRAVPARTRCAAARRLQECGVRETRVFDLPFDLAFGSAFPIVRAGCALLYPGPLCGGEGRSTGPQGDRQGCRSFFAGAGCPVEKPGRSSRTFRAGSPESAKRGGLSFGYFSLATQRKVTRAPKAQQSSCLKPNKSIATEVAPTEKPRAQAGPRPGCARAAPMPPGVGPRHGARS